MLLPQPTPAERTEFALKRHDSGFIHAIAEAYDPPDMVGDDLYDRVVTRLEHIAEQIDDLVAADKWEETR